MKHYQITITVENGVAHVYLDRGQMLLDADNLHLIRGKAVSFTNSGYASVRFNGKSELLHRLILPTPAGMCTDHINHNKLDNRRINLRVCSQANNNKNVVKQPRKTSSQYKGVYWDTDRGMWKARIRLNNKLIIIGRFANEVDAAAAYNIAASRLFRSFSCPNKL